MHALVQKLVLNALSGLCSVLLLAAPLYAARPFITDDARITDPFACQLEAWRKFNRDGHETWVFPACNFTGNLEVTLGGNQIDIEGERKTRDYYLQGKTLFRELQTNSYGVGLAAGLVFRRNTRGDEKELHNVYGYIPTSFSFRDDRVVVHTNLGLLYDRSESRDFLTYGVGGEFAITQRLYGIAEVYGNHTVQLSYQAGFRYWIIPNRWQTDVTVGEQKGNEGFDGRWFTIGFRLISPPFLNGK
jgi:hypothetical protein